MFDRRGRGRLNILNLAQQDVLLAAPLGGALVEKLAGDAAVELVQIHRLDPCLQPVIRRLDPLDGPLACGLLGPVRFEHGVPQPRQDGLRDHKFSKDAGELAGEHLLARVGLSALSPVPGAVVIQILVLFQLTDQEAAAVAALHQPRESEIVFHLPGLVLRSSIQEFLDPLPRLAGDQWFVRALVGGASPVEIAHVQPLAQNLVRGTPIELLTTQRHALAAELLNEALERISASPETGKQLRDDPRGGRVGRDDALAVGAIDVPVPYRGTARIDPRAGFLQHSLTRLFGEIVDDVLGHQDLNAVNQLLRRPGTPRGNLIFLDEMNFHVQLVERHPVLQIAVQTVGLLSQNGSARCMMLLQVGEHLIEVSSTACLGGFDVLEFPHNRKALAGSIVAQEATLGRDAESFGFLILARHSYVEHNTSRLMRRRARGRSRQG